MWTQPLVPPKKTSVTVWPAGRENFMVAFPPECPWISRRLHFPLPAHRAAAERGHERILAQDGLLRDRKSSAEEEEEADRAQYDRRADKLHPPDAHRLGRDGRRAPPFGVRSGADEVQMSKHERQKQSFIAGVPQC